MKTEVSLNRSGELPEKQGYKKIIREVDFLEYATEDIPLLICGERLCTWAEAFYKLHGRPYRYHDSAGEVIRHTFPSLSSEQAIELANKASLDSLAIDDVSADLILQHCYPSDFLVWQRSPSQEHAARWLVWLYEHTPSEAENVILKEFAALLEAKADGQPEQFIYRACNKEQALKLICAWVGLADQKEHTKLSEFPITLPINLLDEIKNQWLKQIISTQGRYFETMLTFPLPLSLRQELAEATALYYRTEDNQKRLTQKAFWQLQTYLSSNTLSGLEEIIPPSVPTEMPGDESSVLDWFEASYLPYRRWQAKYGSQEAINSIRQHAQAFVSWYLHRYPQWLLQPEWISFQQSVRLRESTGDAVVFCIILDGLPAWDAEEFSQQVSARVQRLSLQKKSYYFAPLPTVTQFAKESLLRGVPPYYVSQSSFLGKILPDDGSPLQKLTDAQPNDIIFWRVSQPDAAYHFESESKRERKVHAELESIVYAIKDVVEKLPHHLRLKVIITSDHGRLLNAKSPRKLRALRDMQVHGRVAWGKLQKQFDESGFEIDEQESLIAVHGERFGMTEDMLIAFGEDSFQTSKGGYDSYPHGGLFPEEAIVPWFIFQRDAKRMDLQITLLGKAEAGKRGIATVKVMNSSSMKLKCLSVTLSTNSQSTGVWQISPMSEIEFQVELEPWPSKSELGSLISVFVFQEPNGATFSVELRPSLEVTALYDRDTSLLKDLEL